MSSKAVISGRKSLIAACENPFLNYSQSMILSAVITEAEEGGYVAFNPETGTTTQGESFAEAMENLKEATSLFLEEFPMHPKSPAVMTSFELSHA
jgi:predicted RNase H-like HicB family nuclease